MGKPTLKVVTFINAVLSSGEITVDLFQYAENDPLLLVRLILDLIVVQNNGSTGDVGGHGIVHRRRGGVSSQATMVTSADNGLLKNDDHVLEFPFAGSIHSGGSEAPRTYIKVDSRTKRKIENLDRMSMTLISNAVNYGYFIGTATQIYEIQ